MNIYRDIDRVRYPFDFLVFHSERECYEDEIEALGGRVYHVPIMEGVNVIRRHAMLNSFFAKHVAYDAVHCHMAALGGACLAAAERAGVPIRISHAHVANYDHNVKGYIKRLFERDFDAHATIRLSCSVSSGRYMYGNNTFKVINNGIDSNKFAFNLSLRNAFREAIGAVENEPLIGHVGRLEAVKNQSFLLDVFSEMARCGFSGRLILAGDGSLRGELEERVLELGLVDRVVFLGAIEDMPSFYSGVDLLVMPSLSEGLPFALIEAQCSGLPCIVSDAISAECKITDHVSFLSLDASLKQWSALLTAIISTSSIEERYKGVSAIREAGYDIADVVRNLQRIYSEKI